MFIVFEGIDGAGKTTLASELHKFFLRRGIKSVLTAEPYDQTLRSTVKGRNLNPWGETFIFLGDRNLHVREFIKPKLEEGFTVISDRFYLSTLAYQGYGRGLDLTLLRELNEKATEGLKPDLTFLVDIPVEVALKRIERLRGNTDRFEKREFLQRVREGFLKLAEEENAVILNGERTIYELLGEVIKHIDLFMEQKHKHF